MVHRHRVNVLDWPACSPDLSRIKNGWCVMRRRIRQQLPWTVEAGEVLCQERSTCKTAAINLLSSEMIKSVIKMKGDIRLAFATEP